MCSCELCKLCEARSCSWYCIGVNVGLSAGGLAQQAPAADADSQLSKCFANAASARHLILHLWLRLCVTVDVVLNMICNTARLAFHLAI